MPDSCCYPCLLGTASPTNIIREWLQEWHDEHDVTFDPDLKFEIAWDARWILDSSAEELESDLVNWGCNLATSKRIAKDLMAMKGAKRANVGEGEIIQEISYAGDGQNALCVTQCWFRGVSCALALALFLFLKAFMAFGQVVQQLGDCRRHFELGICGSMREIPIACFFSRTFGLRRFGKLELYKSSRINVGTHLGH